MLAERTGGNARMLWRSYIAADRRMRDQDPLDIFSPAVRIDASRLIGVPDPRLLDQAVLERLRRKSYEDWRRYDSRSFGWMGSSITF